MRTMKTWKLLIGLVAVSLCGALSYAAPGPSAVRPWDDSGMPPNIGRQTVSAAYGGVASLPGMQGSADHIVSQQCGNGGFGWPHADCSATYNNITAPICLGLLNAYVYTGAASHLTAAQNGGNYDLTFAYGNGESRFSTFTPYFLSQLGGAWSTHAETKFFDELTAGTYGPSDLNTAGWIAAVQAGRAGTWVNLLPWEFHTLIPTATAIGNAGQDAAFRSALLAGLNTLDNTAPATVYSDLLGLAGGVRGLALGGTLGFSAIVSPNHAGINGISTLKGLADKLASYQNADGSWYWHSNLGGPGLSDEDTQTTAYASLALVAADNAMGTSYYTSANLKSSQWLYTMRLPSGGFQGWPGGSEDTEVEGEAVSAINIKAPEIPAASEWGLVVLTLIGLATGTILFGRARSAAR